MITLTTLALLLAIGWLARRAGAALARAFRRHEARRKAAGRLVALTEKEMERVRAW